MELKNQAWSATYTVGPGTEVPGFSVFLMRRHIKAVEVLLKVGQNAALAELEACWNRSEMCAGEILMIVCLWR